MAETTSKSNPRGLRRLEVGVVTSDKADKSCTVVIANLMKHPLYGKYIGRRTKLAVHDPRNEAKVGDQVEVTPCRPISKTKRWRLVRVVKKAAVAQVG